MCAAGAAVGVGRGSGGCVEGRGRGRLLVEGVAQPCGAEGFGVVGVLPECPDGVAPVLEGDGEVECAVGAGVFGVDGDGGGEQGVAVVGVES